jgi:type II secretory pathway component GspD/PulD (secretin)
MNRDLVERRKRKFGYAVAGGVLAVALFGTNAWGQTANTASGEKEVTTTLRQDNPNYRADTRPYQTLYLTHVTTQNEANEIVVAVRNLLSPTVKIFLDPSQNAISMRAMPEEMALAQKIINDLDRPKKTYRVTFTISEMDSGKRIGVQHFAMIMTSGQRAVAKQGSRVPLVTGPTKEGSSQVTYVDIGLNFDATLSDSGNGARLSSKVEVTSVAEEKSGVGPQDPVVRQTILDSTSSLQPGKPLVLGSLDIPGSMRHMDIDVMMEPIVP